MISTATGAVTSSIPVSAPAQGVAITPDGKHAYVTNVGGSAGPGTTVSVIAAATGSVSANITVGTSPSGVAITPDGTHAYVANDGDGTVSVITTATGAVSPADHRRSEASGRRDHSRRRARLRDELRRRHGVRDHHRDRHSLSHYPSRNESRRGRNLPGPGQFDQVKADDHHNNISKKAAEALAHRP